MAHRDEACRCWKIKVRNDCSGCLFGGSKRAEEGDHVSPLKSNGQALKQECCLPDVLNDHCIYLPPTNFPEPAQQPSDSYVPAVSMAPGKKR